MTGATGLAGGHVRHAEALGTGLVGKDLGVAVGTFVHFQVELVTEGRISGLDLEGDLPRGHPLVATTAVAGHCESLLVVVAGATGPPLFHFCHSDATNLATEGLASVAAAALAAGFGNMEFVAEGDVGSTLDLAVGDWSGLALVAADAGLVIRNAEGLDPGMACAAGFSLFHLSHGEPFFGLQVEDGVVADPAVVVVLH